jgi:hypothetical protein
MDSTQIASNIASVIRLQLLVEALQRVERILSEADKARLAESFAPYTQDSAGHYTYRVKGKEAQDMNLVQTAIRGLQPNQDKFHLSDFDLHADELGYPVTLTYPHEQTVPVTLARISEWQTRFEGHLRHLFLPTNGTLPCQTLKTRPAQPAGFHFAGNSERQPTQGISSIVC